MHYNCMSNIKILFEKIERTIIWRGFFKNIFFIVLPKQRYTQKIYICSEILSLYKKVKHFYTQKFYTDQP